MMLGIDQRPGSFHGCIDDRMQDTASILRSSRPRVIRDMSSKSSEQQRHPLYLAPYDFSCPLSGCSRRLCLQELYRMANRRQWVAQFMGKGREKFIFAPIRIAQRLFAPLEPADIEIDARPSGDRAVFTLIGTPCAKIGW